MLILNLIHKFMKLYLLLKENKPFMLARYNDGEFIAITQWDFIRNCSTDKIHGNIDGHKYFPEMGTVLRESNSFR